MGGPSGPFFYTRVLRFFAWMINQKFFVCGTPLSEYSSSPPHRCPPEIVLGDPPPRFREIGHKKPGTAGQKADWMDANRFTAGQGMYEVANGVLVQPKFRTRDQYVRFVIGVCVHFTTRRIGGAQPAATDYPSKPDFGAKTAI